MTTRRLTPGPPPGPKPTVFGPEVIWDPSIHHWVLPPDKMPAGRLPKTDEVASSVRGQANVVEDPFSDAKLAPQMYDPEDPFNIKYNEWVMPATHRKDIEPFEIGQRIRVHSSKSVPDRVGVEGVVVRKHPRYGIYCKLENGHTGNLGPSSLEASVIRKNSFAR